MTKRIELLDGLRGIAVCLMILHHITFDAVEFLGAPAALMDSIPVTMLHIVSAGLFFLLCGISSNYSHSNIKRGLKTAAVALLITVVTKIMDMTIVWGVLHELAFCMLLYGIAGEAMKKIPRGLFISLVLTGFVLSLWATSRTWGIAPNAGGFLLWLLGFDSGNFASADYFPVFPWVFVFLAGTWLGRYIKEERFPKRFYEIKMPFFPAVGRHALLIYVVHQPLLYGIAMAIQYLTNR